MEARNLLLEAATTAAAGTDLDGMLQSLGDLLLRATDHSRVLLELWDGEHREVEIAVSRGTAATPKQRFAFDGISDGAKEVITTKKTLVIDYAATGIPGPQKAYVDEHAFLLMLVVPIVYRERLIGLITLDQPGEARPFSPKEIELVEAIAAQAAAAIEHARLHDKALETSRHLSDVFAGMSDGFVSVDRQWRFTQVNPRAEELIGRSAAELVGRSMEELFPDMEGWPQYRKAMEGRTAETLEVWSKRLETWLEVHASPTTEGISILFADISERKRLEEQIKKSEQQARHLIQYAPAAIYEIDLRGPRLTSVNDLMCSFSGYSREELLALDPFELIVEEDRSLFRERIGRVAAGEAVPASVEYRSKMKRGEVRWAALNTSLIYEDGVPIGAFVIAYDVTERKRLEREREQLNASLGATNEILEAALTCKTEEELGRSCLALAQRVTTSKFGFIGEIGSDGLLHDIAIGDSGMQDQTGHRRSPGNLELHSLYGRVLLDGESLLTNSPADHPDGIGIPRATRH